MSFAIGVSFPLPVDSPAKAAVAFAPVRTAAQTIAARNDLLLIIFLPPICTPPRPAPSRTLRTGRCPVNQHRVEPVYWLAFGIRLVGLVVDYGQVLQQANGLSVR